MVNSVSNSIYSSNLITSSSGQTNNRMNFSDLFSKIDSSGDGSIDKVELSAFAEQILSKTGTSIDTEDAIASYDTDGDGALNSDEMKSFMDANAPKPPLQSSNYSDENETYSSSTKSLGIQAYILQQNLNSSESSSFASLLAEYNAKSLSFQNNYSPFSVIA